MTQAYKRRIILIDKEVQLRIAARVAGYWCAAILFVILPLAFLKTFVDHGSLFVGNIFVVCSDHWPVFAMMLMFLPFAVYDSIRMSHKLAGPIHRLRTDLDRYRIGETVTIRFRENDFWIDLPDSINELISRIDVLESQVAEELEHDSVVL